MKIQVLIVIEVAKKKLFQIDSKRHFQLQRKEFISASVSTQVFSQISNFCTKMSINQIGKNQGLSSQRMGKLISACYNFREISGLFKKHFNVNANQVSNFDCFQISLVKQREVPRTLETILNFENFFKRNNITTVNALFSKLEN